MSDDQISRDAASAQVMIQQYTRAPELNEPRPALSSNISDLRVLPNALLDEQNSPEGEADCVWNRSDQIRSQRLHPPDHTDLNACVFVARVILRESK